MKSKLTCAVLFVLGSFLLTAAWVAGVNAQGAATPKMRLMQAVMCELIEDYEPRFIAAAFSISTGRISCYTSFDEIEEITTVDHKWFRRDALVTTKRLTIKPPNWATYSSIQLREADKGPWRVEVWQTDGSLLKTIRFSVID